MKLLGSSTGSQYHVDTITHETRIASMSTMRDEEDQGSRTFLCLSIASSDAPFFLAVRWIITGVQTVSEQGD